MAQKYEFRGKIGRYVTDSEAWFEEPAHPGDNAPNVILVLLDDTGFAQMGCFGSDIDTPHLDALAANGLQFTNFHVTPLCSPTRAALLSGRSNHAVGMRTVSNFSTGFPNQLGHISNHAATVAEVLGDAGYGTFCVGKWHLAPMEQCSAAGPFNQWPLARGFNRFYGFLDGETDQFYPELVADNHPVDPPAGPDEGYHLSEDLVDNALKIIADFKGVRPDRPFLGYVAFGATHAPHQAPASYMAKYRGKFDEGWDVIRERWFKKQIETGVIPVDTQLAPRNPGVKAWDDLSDNEKRLAARMQEAFAAFLDHTDDQIGRLVEGLRHLGQLDNTILVVHADNGASQEGGPFGVMHEMKFFNGIIEMPDEAIKNIDDIGGPNSHCNYPWGWAQCGNTPYRWYKQNTHEGGVHVPMIFHWPNGVPTDQVGTKRDQFVFVADIVPTVYDLVGVTPPAVRNGLEQIPVSGRSFASVLSNAQAPATNTVQYFENAGSLAVVAGEWKAVLKHTPGIDYGIEKWELYHLASDRSECNDLADAQPDKLDEMVALWWEQAETHGVLPLDDRGVQLFGARFRKNSPHPEDRRYVYRPPMSPLPGQATAGLGGRNVDLYARVTFTPGDEGVLYATGTQNSGLSFFVQNNKLVLDYNAFGDHTIVESPNGVTAGDHELRVLLRRGDGMAGQLTLQVDGNEVATASVPLYMRMMSSVGPSIGYDHGSPVSQRYSSPYEFTGILHEVVIEAGKPRADVKAAEAQSEMNRQ
ncbi:MAG: arylsulfatase [Ilumatobacteraceae bacterium]